MTTRRTGPARTGPAAPVALLALVALALTPLLTACGGTSTTGTPTAPSYASASAGALSLSGGWVTTVQGAMAGMAVSSMPSIADEDSAAYATIHNDSAKPDALVGVTTSAAGSAMLHATETSGNGSAGTMVAVHAIPVPAHGSVTLTPGRFHVMLMKLDASFAVGSTITMSWHFRSGTTLSATFPVIDPADRPGGNP